MTNSCYVTCLSFVAAMASPMSLVSAAPDRPPNVLLFMADQMAPQLIGPYGNREVKTPRMDRLAREGVVFTAAYTNSPLCVPARESMMAGRYGSRIGVYDNASVLGSEVPTMGHHLRLAGYETVLSGKMHFVGADQLHGFERRLSEDIYPADFRWTPRWESEAMLNPNGDSKARGALRARVDAYPPQMRYDDNAQQQAIRFLQSRRQAPDASRRPFFLCVSLSDPHPPYAVTQELWDLYENAPITVPKVPEDMRPHQSLMDRWINTFHGVDRADMRDPDAMYRLRRVYYGQCTYVDRKLGELLDCLDRLGELDNTVVLVTSDHGEMLGDRLMVEKRTFYEHSARVPMIAWSPGRWKGGRTCAEPVSLIDIFPTLVELTHAPPPIGIDGRSFLNLLDGRPDSGPPRTAIAEYHGEGVIAPCFMVREGDFKYVSITGGDPQLFNLHDDPDEWHNVAGDPQYHEVESRLRDRILSRFDSRAIDQAVRVSQERRVLMQKAMKTGSATTWDYRPPTSPAGP